MGGKRVTTEVYMEDVKEIHEDKGYTYKPDWEYTGSKCLIDVHCPIHGWWTTKSYSHRGMKSGCPSCAEEYRQSLCDDAKHQRLARESNNLYRKHEEKDNEIIDRVSELYGNDIEILSECVPEGCHVYVKCTLHDHKYFRKTRMLWRGKGCKFCAEESVKNAIESNRKTLEEVIARFREVHGDRYNYSRVDYITAHEKVEIICDEHGPFWITPNNHIGMGSGCASCAKSGFDKNKSGVLYYIKIPTKQGYYYKVGVTNLSTKKRFTRDSGKYEVIKEWYYDYGGDAYDEEQSILKKYNEYRGCPENFEWYSNGTTEMFVCDVLGLDNTM